MDEVKKFCKILRKRSAEHSQAMVRLNDLQGMMASILRQELDSMVRAIFLLVISDLSERNRLIKQTLKGETWTVITKKGKQKKVTDRADQELWGHDT